MDSRGNRIDNEEAYHRHLARLIADRLVKERGMSRPDAVAEARRQLQGQYPLHGPDQRAGGNPEQITGMGDGPINSSIGSQWRNNADDLQAAIDDALLDADIDPAAWGDIRMKVRLRLVDVVPVP
ncbi:polymorphic toxin type 15 domain-containing protein [Cellulomonas sp. NPDC057328]|uniref:polymorphic toxin type 15 domain-containing protein n=1 Tax=Cellulomonas sp. NPDC057328 TaxID=3346101 RepID=UPI00363D5100